MAFLKEIKLVFATLTLVFLHQKSYSQEAKVSVSQDPKFEQLLNEKRKISAISKPELKPKKTSTI
jgi:hypothetical protein